MSEPDSSAAGSPRRAADHPWELRLPARPRFIEDLVRVPIGPRGVLLLGGEGGALQGASIAWVLSELVPLLDGRRSLGELSESLAGVSQQDLEEVLRLLWMNGMLEEGADGLSAA
jgi:hypothetical protein